MNDDTQFVPADGSVELNTTPAQPESTQTQAPVTPTQEAASPLSLTDVERLLTEREAKLRAEFEERERRNKSKSDKAYAAALRDAKVIEQNAEILGLDAETVTAAKRKIIDRTFETAFSVEESPAPQAQPVYPSGVTEAELMAYMKEHYNIEDAALAKKYAGRDRNDGSWFYGGFTDEAVSTAAKQVERRRQEKANREAAQKAGQVTQQFGSVAPPAGGAPSAGYDPEKELEKLMSQDVPNDMVARMDYKRRYDKLLQEVAQKGA